MTNNMYDELAKGSGAGAQDAEARRNASIGDTWNEESEQFLTDVARAKAEGLKVSPIMTIACGYAEGARDAAKKSGQN